MVFDIAEKTLKIASRKAESKKLGAKIDLIVRRAEAETEDGYGRLGCFSKFLNFFRLARAPRGGSASWAFSNAAQVNNGQAGEGTGAGAGAGGAAGGAATSDDFSSRVFGLAGAKKPGAKLEEAAILMRSRILSLEERSFAERNSAKSLMKSGQKLAAKRALLKAMASEKQISTNQASLSAVEQQVDMLAQAAMQKTLTTALASTSKSLKKDSKVALRAEAAIDDASEARDIACDLNLAISEFAGVEDQDDDALLEELNSMLDDDKYLGTATVAEQSAAGAASAAAASAASAAGEDDEDGGEDGEDGEDIAASAARAAKAADIEALESRIREWDGHESIRRQKLSDRKREEKAGLLSS